MLLGVVAVFALAAAGLMERNARADETVDTHAVVGTSGAGPVVECKWELPDMDSSTAGIQYTAPIHEHDDDMTISPDADNDPANGTQIPCAGPPTLAPTQPNGVQRMIQVAPNFENTPEERRIENWATVDNPNDVSDVFWRVFHPDGSFKLQIHGVKLTTAECGTLVGTSGTDGAMTEAAVHTGQVAQAAFDDLNKGMIAKCQQGVKGFYHQEWPLSKDQPCGEYKVELTAVATGGAFTTLTNYIDVECTFMLKIDFGGGICGSGGIDWGNITPGNTKIVGGDLIFAPDCDTAPTTKNVGNDGMGLKISYSKMIGQTFAKEIIDFDACYGRDPSTLYCVPNIPAATLTDLSPTDDQILCANEVGKLDPSVHPPLSLVADTYVGTMDLIGYHISGECWGNQHLPLLP